MLINLLTSRTTEARPRPVCLAWADRATLPKSSPAHRWFLVVKMLVYKKDDIKLPSGFVCKASTKHK